MRAHALVAHDCTFAGHSLGEYAALAAVGEVLQLRDLIDIVFLRGITMQNAVVRDAEGRSAFAMVAVNPGNNFTCFLCISFLVLFLKTLLTVWCTKHAVRVHKKLFREPQLDLVVAAVCKALPGKLLQVVNYNVENYQYVVAGERSALHVLGDALSGLKRQKGDFRCDEETIGAAVKVSRFVRAFSSLIIF